MKHKILLLLILSLLSGLGFGQKKLKYSAGRLVSGIYQGKKVNKLYKNVKFKQEGRTMTCDSAYAFVKEKNKFLGFGHVLIRERNGNTIRSKTLDYNGTSGLAKFRQEVVLKSKTSTLETETLDYFLNSKEAHFFNGGKLLKDGSILTSERGIFNDITELFFFKGDVVLLKNSDTLLTDTLVYDNKRNIAHLNTYTEILGQDKKLYANKGIYNTKLETAHFHQGAKIIGSKYIMVGDSVNYDAKTENGEAFDNVSIFSIEDSMTIFGDYAIRDEALGTSKVFGNALLEDIDGTDSLLLKADTLISLGDSGTVNLIQARGLVSFLHTDVQGKCNALDYGLADSIITFMDSPILWNGLNQITADTIHVFLLNNEIDHMNAIINSFIISEDQPLQYNQVKGRNLLANFQENQLDEVIVNGNGESIYYAYNDQDDMVGLNKSVCSNMHIYLDSNEVKHIKFLRKPDANFIPPEKIGAGDKTLKGFTWRLEERPTKPQIITIFGDLDNRRIDQAFKPVTTP